MVKKSGITFWQSLQGLKENQDSAIGAGRKAWPEYKLLKFTGKAGHLSWLHDDMPVVLGQEDYFATDWYVKEKIKPVKVEGWIIIFKDGTIGTNEEGKPFQTYEEAAMGGNSADQVTFVFLNHLVPEPNAVR